VSSSFCVERFARYAEEEENLLMDIGKEIRRRRKDLGWTLQDLEERTGIDNGNLSRLERGVQSYSQETIEKIANAFGISLGQLFSETSNVEQVKNYGKIPQISWVAAGNWCEATDPFSVGDAEEWWICPVKHGPRTFALKVRGLSMYNPAGPVSFSEGNIIFVDPDRAHQHGSLVVIRLDNRNEATFKRLIADGEKRYLEALNPSWPDRIMPINDTATICGVVIAKLEPL
jgi:SOS-response transcriptional repressor LexA